MNQYTVAPQKRGSCRQHISDSNCIKLVGQGYKLATTNEMTQNKMNEAIHGIVHLKSEDRARQHMQR